LRTEQDQLIDRDLESIFVERPRTGEQIDKTAELQDGSVDGDAAVRYGIPMSVVSAMAMFSPRRWYSAAIAVTGQRAAVGAGTRESAEGASGRSDRSVDI
jgi:hypothetical protein